MRKIKRVATFDLDDTTLDTQEQMTLYVNRVMGLNIGMEFWTKDDFAELFGISREEARKLTIAFHESPEFAAVRPKPEVVDALKEYAEHYDEMIVSTARPKRLHVQTPSYVAEHFPGIFSDIHFTNKHDEHLPKTSKGDICKQVGAVHHYEDVVSHIHDCSAVCEIVFVVDFPWNLQAELPANSHRVKHIRDALPIVRRER